MIKFEINPEKTALLVFDMINEFLKPGMPGETPHLRDELVPPVKKVIEHCRAKNIPVIYAIHTFRRDGSDMGLQLEVQSGLKERTRFIQGTENVEVYQELAPQAGDIVIEKHRLSAFYGTDLELILRSLGKDTLIVIGFSANAGCESTIRFAADSDIKVIVPRECVSSRDLPDMGWGPVPRQEVLKCILTTWAIRFARVTTVEELTSTLL